MSEETKTKKPRAVKAAPKLHPALPKKEDGTVDWKSIVSDKNVILNRFYWAKNGVDVIALDEEEIDRLKKEGPEEGVMLLLAGFRQLAQARGVKSTKYEVVDRTEDRATVIATLTLVPTVEEPYEVTICGVANCSLSNSSPDFFVHAEALASNRAFNRAWREYFNMSSVSYEETNPLDEPEISRIPDLYQTLKNKLDAKEKTEADITDIIDGRFVLSSKWNGALGSLTASEMMQLINFLSDPK